MGQILSCRDNLFPPAWITAMEKLQDQVPARRGDDALQLAYDAMGGKEEFDRVFSDFDPEPLAGKVDLAKCLLLSKDICSNSSRAFTFFLCL